MYVVYKYRDNNIIVWVFYTMACNFVKYATAHTIMTTISHTTTKISLNNILFIIYGGPEKGRCGLVGFSELCVPCKEHWVDLGTKTGLVCIRSLA